jgi:hypothetical protein
LEEKLNTFSNRIQQRIGNYKYCLEKSDLGHFITRDGSVEFFWRAAPDGVMEEVYFSPLRMTDLEKCLIDVIIEFFQGKNISKWAQVSFREIENFLRDSNDKEAFPPEMVNEELLYSWVGQLIYEVLINIARWSEGPQMWENLSQVEKIKGIQSILRAQIPKIELIDLAENEITISLARTSATIQKSLALFTRELLRREFGHPKIEIILES